VLERMAEEEAEEVRRPWRRLMGHGGAICAMSEWGERRSELVRENGEREPKQRAVSRASPRV
jgi:hypothetical protein